MVVKNRHQKYANYSQHTGGVTMVKKTKKRYTKETVNLVEKQGYSNTDPSLKNRHYFQDVFITLYAGIHPPKEIGLSRSVRLEYHP